MRSCLEASITESPTTGGVVLVPARRLDFRGRHRKLGESRARKAETRNAGRNRGVPEIRERTLGRLGILAGEGSPHKTEEDVEACEQETLELEKMEFRAAIRQFQQPLT